MDVTTAFLSIKRQFGDEYDILINDDDIYRWIYEAELDIIRNAGSNPSTTTGPANTFPVAIPTNVQIKRVFLDGRSLVPISLDEIDELGLSSTHTGERPTHWYVQDNSVYLWPTCTITDTVTISYEKTPTLMSGPTAGNSFTVPEVYHTDIVLYCVAKAHNKDKDHVAERNMLEMYQQNVSNRRDEADSYDGALYKGLDPLDYEDNYGW
jgi:hypothetical protein